jgi:hypothetical protein
MRVFLFLIIQLVALCDGANAKSDEEFLKFLTKFSSDKEFQIQRIKFPITKNSYTKDLKDTVIKIESSRWQFVSLIQPKTESITDIGYSFKDDNIASNQRVFSYIGIETGVNVKYFFKRINRQWYLVKIEDYST